MRFERHVKIFRGQLDPAPFAGVLFLLVIFVLLGFLLYTPGVLVELKNEGTGKGSVIKITRDGRIIFAGKTNSATETNLAQLRADIGNLPETEPLQLVMEPGASTKLRDQVRNLFTVEPPLMTEGMVGTDNPVVIVAVNLRGQYFFENRKVEEAELESILKERLTEASKESKKLTMVLLQDNGVPMKTFVRVSSIAKKVGIAEMIIATRPGTFGKVAPSP
jgi:biopolymer transport protein ExbD